MPVRRGELPAASLGGPIALSWPPSTGSTTWAECTASGRSSCRAATRPYEEQWEVRTFAMSTIVGIEGIGKGSGRAIREEMEPEHYLRASYYERWLWSTEQRLLRKGTIAPGEVDAWVERLLAGEPVPQRLDPGAGGARPRRDLRRRIRSATAESTAVLAGRPGARAAVAARGPHALPALRAGRRRAGDGRPRHRQAARTSARTRARRARLQRLVPLRRPVRARRRATVDRAARPHRDAIWSRRDATGTTTSPCARPRSRRSSSRRG